MIKYKIDRPSFSSPTADDSKRPLIFVSGSDLDKDFQMFFPDHKTGTKNGAL